MLSRVMSDTARYVALGDSISIDDYAGGPGRGGASLLARNRDEDFPEWTGRDLTSRLPDLDYHLLALDGGTTRSVVDVQLPRLEAMWPPPSVVTLTVGGNDVLAAYGDTRLAAAVIREVRAGVDEALTRIAEVAAPDASVALGNVYDPSDGTGDAPSVGLPPWPDVVAVLRELNTMLSNVAAEHGVGLADLHGRFSGHGLSRGNPAQTDARPADRELWYCNIIEPNAWGASAVRAAFWDVVC